MLPLHTYQKINPLKTRYIVMKHRSVWKLTEKWRHKINTCLIIKLIRIVLLLIAFQMHSLSIYFSHLLSHPQKKPISSFNWPAPTLLFTLANNKYRVFWLWLQPFFPTECMLDFCIWFFTIIFTLTLWPSACSVFFSKKLKIEKSFYCI